MVQTILHHRSVGHMPNSRLEAILFDLDGLAVDSEPIHGESIRLALEEDGRSFDPAVIGPYLGRPARDSSEAFARLHGLDTDDFHARREAHYLALVEQALPFRPRLAEAVTLARSEGLRLGLVTSGVRDYAEAALRHLRAEGIDFEVVIAREDVTHAKPHPEPYLTAARLLGIDPAACAVLEDAPSGVEAAHRARMTVVAVPNEHTAEMAFPGADTIAPDLEAAVRWLLDRRPIPREPRPGLA
jgi:HAD superfamily hydrolase (TIGR01509 family)